MNWKRGWIIAGMLAAVTASAVNGVMPLKTEPALAESSALKQFKAAGKNAALTVYPTRVAGTSIPKVAEVIAMMLENGGMTKLELSDREFKPAEGADLNIVAAAFAEFVKTKPPETDYALFAEVLGTPGKGAREVRTVVVTKAGEIVWKDRQVKGDREFDTIKPREPIQCCLLVAKRVQPLLGLDDPGQPKAGKGRIAQRWAKETGIPDDAMLAQIKAREVELQKRCATASLTVYPVRIRKSDFSQDHAATVVLKLAGKGFSKLVVHADGPRPEIEPSINEQKVLWSTARAVSEHVKAHPPTTDYVLYGEYFLDKDAVRAIHYVICNRNGDLVVVGFQNSHSPEFKAKNPGSVEDCDLLLVECVAAYCKSPRR